MINMHSNKFIVYKFVATQTPSLLAEVKAKSCFRV